MFWKCLLSPQTSQFPDLRMRGGKTRADISRPQNQHFMNFDAGNCAARSASRHPSSRWPAHLAITAIPRLASGSLSQPATLIFIHGLSGHTIEIGTAVPLMTSSNSEAYDSKGLPEVLEFLEAPPLKKARKYQLRDRGHQGARTFVCSYIK
ncbi:hypothetical protein B0H14DRAFT_2557110 [Mycena olivaceomarginata]|nr:hypothetical protein B0H14DRAFT_2557110 [Mycena olivaceomarginata]